MHLFTDLSSTSRRRKPPSAPIMSLLLATFIACLALTVSAKDTAADYFVHSLPGAPEDIPLRKMHAGHVEVAPDHGGNLFFWLFENRKVADRPRLVIWLNGGPGCSSEDGALMEIGPYRVREGGNLELVDGSWDEYASLLFVDNPVGTGFSYVDTDSYLEELDQMRDQFILFLEKWFDIFPQYSHDDIYIAGESYAGQHIPYIARGILDHNKSRGGKPWNLKGLLIGNGWISGTDQYPAYLQFSYEHGLIQGGTPQANTVEKKQAECFKALSDGGKDHVDEAVCEEVLQDILRVTSTATKNGDKRECYNMYDIRLKDEYPSCGMAWPPDLEHVTPYLRRTEVVQALHVNGKRSGWTECNGAVSNAFRTRKSIPSIELLPGLLAEVPILLFSGAMDLICNHLGTESIIENLTFNGAKGMGGAPKLKWTFGGEDAGMYQSARNLTYLLFHNASHMVPFDYPRRSRDMIDRFMGVDMSLSSIATHVEGEAQAQKPGTGAQDAPPSSATDQNDAVKEAEWKAYYRSGELALVVVACAASLWGFLVLRARRRRRLRAGTAARGEYTGVRADEEPGEVGGNGVVPPWRKGRGQRDLEAADFDENELEELAGEGSGGGGGRERYSLGGDSEEDSDATEKAGKGVDR